MGKLNNIIKKLSGANLVVFLLLLLTLFFVFTTEGFATSRNFFSLLRQISIIGIVTFGMSIVIISGGIDLSIGSSMSVVSITIAILISQYNVSPIIAGLIGIGLGMIIGLINGLIITTTNMTPFICTLAAMGILRGISYTISGGLPIYGLPESFIFLGKGYLGPIPIPVIIMIVVFAFAIFLLSRTYIGRYFYAVGSNAEAARLSGLNVKRIKILSYIICGLFVGIASIVITARVSSGQPNAGEGMEMDVITACVVGGISMAGGLGKMSSVILGVLVMGVISNGLGIMGVSQYDQFIAKGLILLFVVGIDSYRTSHQKKRSTNILKNPLKEMEITK